MAQWVDMEVEKVTNWAHVGAWPPYLTRDFHFLTPPCLPIKPLGGLELPVILYPWHWLVSADWQSRRRNCSFFRLQSELLQSDQVDHSDQIWSVSQSAKLHGFCSADWPERNFPIFLNHFESIRIVLNTMEILKLLLIKMVVWRDNLKRWQNWHCRRLRVN